MKYFSLFSGIGGFELGIDICFRNRKAKIEEEIASIKSLETCQSGLQRQRYKSSSINRPQAICIGFSEIDKYAAAIYKKHFPTHKEYGNVQEIKWNDVEDFELLVGGFPCQSFSIAGKRRGFDDTRGTLFFEIARAAQEKQPRLLLLENVKGLLSHDKGRTFGTILHTLDELGYDLQWQVLNSKNFGVPQNRERVFIVGHLRGTSRPQVFPIGTQLKDSIKQTTELPMQISNTIRTNYSNGHANETYTTQGVRIRRLTPTECERLQGFPDGYTERGVDLKGNYVIISDTQRYKVLGNAVTTNVVKEIVCRLAKYL